ncbi:MAG: tetratricopeptide repeat protein [Candidatus Zixiibacteriota bacterium]
MTSIRFTAAVVLLSILLLASVDISAQQEQGTAETEIGQAELNANINFCRGLMRERNYEGASALLETLYEKYPDNTVVISLLIQCYDQLQYYTKAAEIIQRYLKNYPDNFNMRLLYAEVLAKQGELDRSEDIYRQVAESIAVSNVIRLQAIVQSMVRHNLGDRIILFIDSLRALASDSTLFAIQRGSVLESKKLYREAVLEYYPLLRDTSRTGNDAEKRIMDLLDFADSQQQAEEGLLAQSDLPENARALKILSTYYLKSGRFDEAFDFTVSRDSLEGFDGGTLLSYMQTCLERKLYQQAARMGEYLFGRREIYRPGSEVYLVYADALVRLHRYDEAIAVLDDLFATAQEDGVRVEALYALGLIHLDALGDNDRAIDYFDSAQFFYSRNPAYLAAMMTRPICYLRKGELQKAAEDFDAGLKLNPPDEVRERAEYYKALILFFEKQYDSSHVALKKLLVDHPRGLYVNDAVRMMVIIDEAGDSPEQLYDYSNALLFEERRMSDSAMAGLSKIANDPDAVLADIALLGLAELSLSQADSLAAVRYIDSLSIRFEDSYYRPYGLKLKADIFAETVELRGQAVEIYRSLLEKHANYPFIPAVRKKMRELQEISGSA